MFQPLLYEHTMNNNRNKQVACKICYRKMRSDVLQRHMKVHEIHFLDEGEASFNQLCKNIVNEAMKKPLVDSEANQEMNYDSRRPTKRKIEDFDAEGAKLRKYLNKHNDEYNRKIILGKEVYKILGEGNIQEASLPKEMKEALNLYMSNDHDMGRDDVELKPWQKELFEQVTELTDRKIIWVVGKSCGEGKTWFQKYIKYMLGRSRVASGISIKATTPNICHALAKHPLATTDIFLFNIGKSKKKSDVVNYEVLEDLKDGDAFASKYNSQQLKIKTPNVIMVFSNEKPDTKQLAMDRWKLFYIENDSLVEKQVVKNGDFGNSIIPKKQKMVGLTEEEWENLEDELCLNLCWRGYHICNEKDEDNLLLGIDISYLRSCIYNDDVKNKFKCQACYFAREEMEEVNKHFMDHHRDTFRLPCSECKMKFKTINQLKNHYASKHFKKKKNREYFFSEQEDMYANTY